MQIPDLYETSVTALDEVSARCNLHRRLTETKWEAHFDVLQTSTTRFTTCNVAYRTILNVAVRLEHSHIVYVSFDNHSTASGPSSCRRRRHPGNAVSGHSQQCALWSGGSLRRDKQVMRSRPICREIRHIWPGHIADDLE